ncbi:MAG: hypothetical protein AAGU11_14990 [Syntrophobacteraceae bacterium]
MSNQLDLILDNGDMAGDFFGLTKQLQNVCKAMTITDRIYKQRGMDRSPIRMSQFMVNLLDFAVDLSTVGEIATENKN